MFKPSLEAIKGYEKGYSHVPIYMEMYMDLFTPIQLLKKLRDKKSCFLLESMEGEKQFARYSFIGYEPYEVVTSQRGENPYVCLNKRLEGIRVKPIKGLPPFIGGGIGYLGYDTVQYVKPVNFNKPSVLQVPEMMMMFFKEVIVFDHEKQKVLLIALLELGEEGLEAHYEKAKERILGLKSFLEQEVESGVPEKANPITFMPSETKASYLEKVEKVQSYIRAGDIFQAVLSTQFHFKSSEDLFHIYRVLRVINPSPYMYYIKHGDLEIAGASPETLVKVEGQKVLTMPIAGTKPRGIDEEEDLKLEEELLADEKEKAEHRMLVDLARNDIGMISTFKSVNVSRYQVIKRYSHVMHIVSEVEGKMREGISPLEAVASILPAGTLSGAPKIRAMEIIDELEVSGRGIYGGGIGYISFNGSLDLCIGIRTIVKKGEEGILQAGAGIVLDSVPEKEYSEAMNKLGAQMNAIGKEGELR